MGLDVGTHRIGVAVSDELQIIATPEGTLHISQKNDGISNTIQEIVALVQRFAVRRIVVGMPRSMKGERGVQAVWTEGFTDQLRQALAPFGVYISFVDEQLTTAQAARTYQQPRGHSRGAWSTEDQATQKQSRGRSRSARPPREGRTTLDARAAALILQGYLDRRKRVMSNEQ
ncbi:MAG: Holliday junction resolvase RuvX [Thermomicrobia bacterium]|nr:Holliday junction resolvase RuvX [Thermomicrobia bacterium]